jgi:hypothetical protein
VTSPVLGSVRFGRARLCAGTIMSTEDDSIHQNPRSFETALRQLLHTARDLPPSDYRGAGHLDLTALVEASEELGDDD